MVQSYSTAGFYVARGLLGQREVEMITDAFVEMHDRGGVTGYYSIEPEGLDQGFLHPETAADPLSLWPRVMHPHRFMPIAQRYLLDARILGILRLLVGEDVLAAQSMFYFKPPGARGQAWHQDNFYLRVSPGTCIAAWIAIDPSDEDNGGLQVIPNTQRFAVACPERSDPSLSFASELVPPPAGVEPVQLQLGQGDVLFFNGSVIHGSTPNRSTSRFRRSLINHYVGKSCLELSDWYLPLVDPDGNDTFRPVAQGGGPCGDAFPGPH
ncbi:MAG TPA: phytanoyl-CoA dioxygenase family protein [Polyangiaceae bacterium]|jgi:hypothetical protein